MYEKFNNGISHNMAMLPGPNLNHKIVTAVLMNRFDKLMIAFDIKKAFLSIKLYECDQTRLSFLWYRNVDKNDFNVIAYKNVRLSFGLRNSPTILMLGLYKLLMLDKTGDERVDAIKRSIYNCIYMDNGSYSCNSEEELKYAYETIQQIFESHKLFLQQFYTNSVTLQSSIDDQNDAETTNTVKYFGMNWNRVKDSLAPIEIKLDALCSTKRKVLASLNSIFDIYNLYAPILLRAKLFLQRLLTNPDIAWDTQLSHELQKEWQSICKQVNSAPAVEIPRSIGARDSNYSLVAMTDASKDAYGTVIYIKDLNTGQVSYLTAKNRLINTSTSKKTIPSLEFQALAYGVEILYDVFQSLHGDSVVIPINIESCYLFTDSMVCVHWLIKYSIHFEKLQSLSVFVKNRLRYVDELCSKMPVTFMHIAGEDNPADYLTRPTTHKALSKTSYYSGPSILFSNLKEAHSDLTVSLPNPSCKSGIEVPDEIGCALAQTNFSPPPGEVDADDHKVEHLISLDKFSNFKFLVNVTAYVFKFIGVLRRRVLEKSGKNENNNDQWNNPDYHGKTRNYIISVEQQNCYPQVYSYFNSKQKHSKDIPKLITKYNLYRDKFNVLRIRSKFAENVQLNPVLLSNSSVLTNLIILHTHVNLGHTGIYSVIRELRKHFWIEKALTAVKKCLRSCIVCKRIHERPVKTNQNCYRSFRANPPQKPFRAIFLDHIGPFTVNLQGQKTKVWLLAITCLFSRAVNLKISLGLSVKEFLKAVQIHCHEYGMFQECLSDLGSQIQAGAHTIKAFLSDFETRQFLGANGIQDVQFQHYAKGNSALGSLIETCVKQIKFFIQKSIRTNVLDYFEFEFLISKAVNLINKRPIAFMESLRSLPHDQLPTI